MSAADLLTVVIACPNCGTRYQVPYGTIGAAGREVQCAQCSKPWHAEAEPPALPDAPPLPQRYDHEDRLFSAADERALDEAFETEARSATLPAAVEVAPDGEQALADIKSSLMPRRRQGDVNAVDPARLNQTRQDFAQRQKSRTNLLPMARVRRSVRIAALLTLVALLGLGLVLRTDIVRSFPSLAGLYEAIGLPVNVVGLEFHGTRTLMSFRAGKPMMLITSNVRSIADRTVKMPPILISLVDAGGRTVYEWTVPPRVSDLAPGESIEFSTEVATPPQAVVTVRLTFTNPRGATLPAAPAGTI